MTTEDEVRKITTDLQSVTILVARLGTMQENSEKRIDTLTGVTQEAVNGMNRLNERMSATVGMERDIAGIKETLGERFGDIRAIRHDLNNVLTSMGGIPILNDKINENAKLLAAQGVKIEALETWRDKVDGAAGAVAIMGKVFWAVFGGAIITGIYVVVQYVASHVGVGNISGE